MKTKTMWAAVLVFCLPFGAVRAGEGIVRLKDGTFLFGEVVAHDESGVQVRRLDNGGLVSLKWGHLFPAEEDRLRIQFGYKDQSGEEVIVDADRLKLDDGSTVVGVIVDRSEKDIQVKIRGSLFPVPKARIAAPVERVQVNALDVYTREELRDGKVADLAPQTAADHLELARYLVRIRDIRGALESYKKAQSLDASFHPEEVAAAVARLELQAARQEEIDWVDSIDSARGKKDYTKALQLCEEFAKKWPQSTFLAEVNRKKLRIEEERNDLVHKTVVLRWYANSEKLAGKVGSDRDKTLAEAQSYAESKMSKEVLEKVGEELKKLQPDIAPEKVRALWEKRGKLAVPRRAVYGDGTFVLGAERAQKDLAKEKEKEKKEKKEKTEEDELREKLSRYVQAALKAQAKAGGGGGGEEEAPEAWWRNARSSERQQWVLAYYAEFGGDMQLLHPFAEPCQTCGGAGVITLLDQGGGSSGSGGGGGRSGGGNQGSGGGTMQVACPTCHKVQIKRGVYFK